MDTLVNILLVTGSLVFAAGLIGFLKVNAAIIKHKALLRAGWGTILFIAAAASVLLFNKQVPAGCGYFIFSLAVLAVFAAGFTAILFKSLIRDYFQPLSLTESVTAVLITGSVAVFCAGVLSLVLNTRSGLSIILPAAVLAMMLPGIIWAKTQGFAAFENTADEPKLLFVNGECGYRTFRIPSLVALDKDVLNEKYGFALKSDVLLATAEGRRNTFFDNGDIDLVGKISADGGKTWSALEVLFADPLKDGKVGNPAPVFDKKNGILNFVLSSDSRGSENIHGILNKDFSIAWTKRIPLKHNGASIVPGPGKSIQLKTGRLLVPAGGRAFYSDDYGLTWQAGDMARGGECEAVELENGEVMMVTRFGPGCSKSHPKQCQKLSFSNDGGETWHKHSDTPLKTPMCQSSLDKTSDGTLYFTHPDCYLTRANLAVGVSRDNGENWTVKHLYSGPSGYSCVCADSEDNVFVLAEIGRMNYNEALVFIRLEK